MSRATARQDMARPSVASVDTVVLGVTVVVVVDVVDDAIDDVVVVAELVAVSDSGGKGGKGLLLGLAGEGTTGGGGGTEVVIEVVGGEGWEVVGRGTAPLES